MIGSNTVFATFASAPVGTPVLDIDGDGRFNALIDGPIVSRYLSDVLGVPLLNGALGSGATRTTETEIADHLADIEPLLDIDGDGRVDALTDGELLNRYLSGQRGAKLIEKVVGPGAIRTTAHEIETQIQSLIQKR